MTMRERRLAYIILTFIVLAGIGFFGYQFYLQPLKAKEQQINSLHDEIDLQEQKVAKIHADKKRLAVWAKASLPWTPNTRPDAEIKRRTDVASSKYVDLLSDMLKQSGFDASAITPKAPDNKNVPQLAKNRPAYVRLDFTVDVKGDLATLVAWMEKFYQQRLLHQVKDLTITRPMSPDRTRPNDLDFKIVVEALVLDQAEQRKTLEPATPVALPPLLAPGRQYASIAGKNIFFGPPPAVAVEREDPPAVFVDASPHIWLDGIHVESYEDEKGVAKKEKVATLYDAYHNQKIEVRPRAAGDGFRTEVSYYVNGNRRFLRGSKDGVIDLLDEASDTRKSWTVVKMTDRGLIIRQTYPVPRGDMYYRFDLGYKLSEAVMAGPLSKADIAKEGIKPETKPASESDKEKEAKEAEVKKDQ